MKKVRFAFVTVFISIATFSAIAIVNPLVDNNQLDCENVPKEDFLLPKNITMNCIDDIVKKEAGQFTESLIKLPESLWTDTIAAYMLFNQNGNLQSIITNFDLLKKINPFLTVSHEILNYYNIATNNNGHWFTIGSSSNNNIFVLNKATSNVRGFNFYSFCKSNICYLGCYGCSTISCPSYYYTPIPYIRG